MSQLRIGVIGAGLIGRKHIEVLRADDAPYALAGVADPSSTARAEAAELGYPCYATTEELLECAKPDGAIIAVPNQLHVAVGVMCISHGIPILIEKPVADTVGDALRLIEAAEAACVPTMVGHHRRHNPIMKRACELIRDGAVGTVIAANSIWLSHKPAGYHDLAWRREPGGGPILINAIHDIDCLRMLCGDIETVQAVDSNATRGFAVEDTAAVILRFKSGALGTLLISDTVSSPWSWETTSGENPEFPNSGQDSILIGGTRGSLAIPSLDLRWHEQGKEDWLKPLAQKREDIVPADPYIVQMGNFADVIRGIETPVVSGRDGMMTLAATLAISAAAKSGEPVRVDDMLQRAILR